MKQVSPRNELVERLEVYLQEKKFRADDKIPSERELCATWNVNRSTLRAALKILAERGLLYAVAGKGYFCKKAKLLRDLQSMHSLAETAAEQGFNLRTEVLQKRVIVEDKYLTDKLHMDRGEPVFELVRLRYLNSIPAMLEYSYLNLGLCPELDQVDFQVKSLYQTLEQEYELEPKQGRQKIAVTQLTQTEAELLDLGEASPAIFLNGYSYHTTDFTQPIEFFKSIIRIDLVEFSSALRVIHVKGD